FVDSRERLWLLWPVILANEWHTALMKYRISGPREMRWRSTETMLFVPRNFEAKVKETLEPQLRAAEPGSRAAVRLKANIDHAADKYFSRMGWMTRVHPLELPSGRILVPLYSDGFSFSLIAITDDGGETWTTCDPPVGVRNIHPTAGCPRDSASV